MVAETSIQCPIFLDRERKVTRLTEQINRARTVAEKGAGAEELSAVVDGLLTCDHYQASNLECVQCRSLARLRQETAALILKAGRLVRRER